MLEPSASDGPGHFDGVTMDLDLVEAVLSLRFVWITEKVLEPVAFVGCSIVFSA